MSALSPRIRFFVVIGVSVFVIAGFSWYNYDILSEIKNAEGVINGLMTARIGIAAMDLCRPLPFRAVKRPGIGDFMSDIAGFAARQAEPRKDAEGL